MMMMMMMMMMMYMKPLLQVERLPRWKGLQGCNVSVVDEAPPPDTKVAGLQCLCCR